MNKHKVILTLTEDLLGTVPKDRDIYESYITSKAELPEGAAEQELATVPENLEEKGWTGFHTTAKGEPIIYDYVIKGFLKDACGMLRRVKGTKSSKVTAYKKIIDGLVFVEPRKILLVLNGDRLGVLERPLRAQTAQGERVSLARSDVAPAGTMLEFTILVLGEVDEALLREWLDYGSLRGLGQWRNASWGRFSYEMEAMPG